MLISNGTRHPSPLHIRLAQIHSSGCLFVNRRSQLPGLELDAVFEAKEELALSVQNALAEIMTSYGYQIVQVLITDLDPDQRVKNAMNEINSSKRLKVTAFWRNLMFEWGHVRISLLFVSHSAPRSFLCLIHLHTVCGKSVVGESGPMKTSLNWCRSWTCPEPESVDGPVIIYVITRLVLGLPLTRVFVPSGRFRLRNVRKETRSSRSRLQKRMPKPSTCLVSVSPSSARQLSTVCAPALSILTIRSRDRPPRTLLHSCS